MSNTPFSFIPDDPSYVDSLNLHKREIFLDLNCHHIGTVQSFNAANQTAVVKINYPKTYFTLNPQTQTYTPVQVPYPTLIDCPVIFLGGGGTSLSFPVAKGDECFVLFNDRDIDNWFIGGTGAQVATPRAHHFSDAIILVGLRSKGNVIQGFDSTNVVLNAGAAKIKLMNNGTTLNTLLQSLLTQLENLCTQLSSLTVTGVTTGPGVSGVPSNSTAINTISTNLTNLGTQISGLLS